MHKNDHSPPPAVVNMSSRVMNRPSASPLPAATAAIPSTTPMRAAMTRTTSEGAERGQNGQQGRRE